MIKKIFVMIPFIVGAVSAKEYTITCTAIINNERTCFVEGTSDGRITFTIPCECDCKPEKIIQQQPKEEEPNENLIEQFTVVSK